MASHIEGEEQEALFQSYPCSLYYVQSPSAASNANSSSDCRNTTELALLSPFTQEDNFAIVVAGSNNRSRDLSRHSSSRGSNNSFLHEKKLEYDMRSHDGGMKCSSGTRRNRLVVVDEDGDKRNVLWRFLALDSSSSCCCIAFQITWRFMVSLGVALLVFFLATKPPIPKVSFKISGIPQFSLGEGLDNTGVVTTILTSNCSMDMEIDNKSKVFGLHISPIAVDMVFGHLKFASSQGEHVYVESDSSLILRLYVGAKDKPMYAAGRSMQDMLKSGQGLPLATQVSSKSSYQVLWNIIRSRYHHHAECFMVLEDRYDEKNHTQMYKSTCSTTTSHV